MSPTAFQSTATATGAPAKPKMADLGILASLDPVALDRACVDMVFNSSDPGKDDLIERINSRHGTHILDAAEELGLGSQNIALSPSPTPGKRQNKLSHA